MRIVTLTGVCIIILLSCSALTRGIYDSEFFASLSDYELNGGSIGKNLNNDTDTSGLGAPSSGTILNNPFISTGGLTPFGLDAIKSFSGQGINGEQGSPAAKGDNLLAVNDLMDFSRFIFENNQEEPPANQEELIPPGPDGIISGIGFEYPEYDEYLFPIILLEPWYPHSRASPVPPDPVPEPVPEPSTFLLFGTVLIGISAIGGKKFLKRK